MSDFVPPEDVHAPKIAAQLEQLAAAIYKESGASTVVIHCRFTYDGKAGKGKLKLNMEVSGDSKVERFDGLPPQPKGTKDVLEAEKKAASVLKRYGEGNGKTR